MIYFEEIDSTSSYAKRNLDDLPDKTVICALRQTDGHGQFGREWVDLGGENLFISMVLDELKPDLTIYTAEVICWMLAKYGVSAEIKPPNDVLVDGKKIAGILAETVTRAGKTGKIVLGIGINLNAQEEDLARVTGRQATALNLETGQKIEREKFMLELLHELDV